MPLAPPQRTPLDMADILSEITVPDLGSALSDFREAKKTDKADLFAEQKRKGWDKTVEARSLWQKSLFGRTLTDIKGDDSMVGFFADELAPVIKDILGTQLASGDWCIITTPKRRHTTKNFATRISERLAEQLHIPFYEDVCSCHTKQRMNAVFTVNVIPKEQNIICFDDFVTTGQTLHSMKVALEPHKKNLIFFAGINNKL